MKSSVLAIIAGLALLLGVACSQHTANNASYKDNVSKALEQADLKDVDVSEDKDKNTITLSGNLHTEDAKQQAATVAKGAAPDRVIVNEISVRPVGAESEAKKIDSNLDDGIENNFKAALISKGLDKESIKFDAKNGVLTLTGSVKAPAHRAEAEKVADNIPNVQQVVNEIEVKR